MKEVESLIELIKSGRIDSVFVSVHVEPNMKNEYKIVICKNELVRSAESCNLNTAILNSIHYFNRDSKKELSND